MTSIGGGNNSDYSGGCASGAAGSVIGEYVASEYRDEVDEKIKKINEAAKTAIAGKPMTETEAKEMIAEMRRYGVDVSRFVSAVAVFAFGGNVDIASYTAGNLPNTQIPATFKLKSGSSEFYVNSNATKHMGEYLQKYSNTINDQQFLSSFSSAIDGIVSSGKIELGKVYDVNGWEIIFSQRAGDALPVIKHALYKP